MILGWSDDGFQACFEVGLELLEACFIFLDICRQTVLVRFHFSMLLWQGRVGETARRAPRSAAIDRAALSKHVVGDEAAMKRLEEAVHPLVEAARSGRPQPTQP